MYKEFEKEIENCLKTLKNGETLLYPTDTVWGLGCDASQELAVQKIIDLKNRPANKSFVVLVSGEKMLKSLVANLDEKVFDFLRHTLKPTTVVYPEVAGLAESVYAPDLSVAIRICSDLFCKRMIDTFGKPILSTSANKSGEPTPRIFKEVDEEIVKGVGYVVGYRQNDETIAEPSTIVKWENESLITLRK